MSQSQYHCRKCKRPTLHARPRRAVPTLKYILAAVASVLASLLIPFAWLLVPVLACLWVLHCGLNMVWPNRWRCQTCGEAR